MNPTISFDIRYLKACNIIADKNSHRYYLEGVALQWDGATLVSVATDGHRMMAFKIRNLHDKDLKPFSMIIPRSTLDLIKINKNEFTCTLDPEKKFIDYNETVLSFNPIDGQFPDWQRVCPSEVSGKTAQFNPKYLVDFEKAASLWNKGARINISHNGDGPSLVDLGIPEVEGFGVIMPMRESEHPLTTVPAWVTQFKTPSTESIAA